MKRRTSPARSDIKEFVLENVKIILRENAELVENELCRLTEAEYIGEGKLQDAMKYSLLGGGKRIRACLAIEFCKLFGGTAEKALPYAAAVEMIHAYSLIHDDLPCMDDDDIRRGKPSCHIAFGEATALLAGDTLLTYAMECAARGENVTDYAAREIVLSLAREAGALGMAGGQQIDLQGVSSTYDELKKLHSMKTAALIKTAATIGYLATVSDKTDEKILADISKYSECIGLAFQIKDDLLDLEGDAETLGKAVGIDAKNGRVNALTFLFIDEAQAECERLSREASEIVAPYPNSEFLKAFPMYLNSRNK